MNPSLGALLHLLARVRLSVLLLCVLSTGVHAKQAVDFRVALTFPDQGIATGREARVVTIPAFAKSWDRVVLTARVVVPPDSPVPSSSEQVAVTGRIEKLRSDLAGLGGEIPVPLTMKGEGELLVQLEFEFRQGESVTGRGKISVGLLAAAGRVWFGRDSIEMAFVERTKTELGIKGEPKDAGLAELNRRWEAWLKRREKLLRERDRPRDRQRAADPPGAAAPPPASSTRPPGSRD